MKVFRGKCVFKEVCIHKPGYGTALHIMPIILNIHIFIIIFVVFADTFKCHIQMCFCILLSMLLSSTKSNITILDSPSSYFSALH